MAALPGASASSPALAIVLGALLVLLFVYAGAYFAVVKKDERLTAEEVLAHCREHLTNYKVPNQIEFRKELPKTNVGKILRRALREENKAA